ncbi:SLBB domain-containing protein [Pedobacter steynii]
MKFKKIFKAFLFFFAMLISVSAYAQQIDYASIKVDDLTDAQIKELMKRAESIGYDDAQLEQLAAAQGMKDEEIKKLKIRVENIRNQGASGQEATSTSADPSTKRIYIPADSTETEKPDSQKSINNGIKPEIFGSKLFSNSSLKFEPNLRMATPKNYVIGPDDELLVDITGDNEASYKLKVSPDGNIKMQYVGLIAVGGLSIEQATSKVRATLSKTYPALKSGRTNVSVNLGNIKSIRVSVLGEVVKPGTYTLSSLSSVFNLLYASGGPNEKGSFRKIQVIRNNKVISTIDIYSFLLKGIQTGNIRLQDQDVINVPVYQSRVEIAGEVKRPALFEVLNTESLQEVINFAGGFSDQAYSAKIKVFQNTNKERKIVDVKADDFSTYYPLNGDRFVVERILDRFENRVEIKGAVFRPGIYELNKGLTLSGLITKADGIKEDAFLNRGYISRLNADNTYALLSFDVAKILNGTQPDIPLLREDKVTISSIFDLREEYKVTIQGEVRQPGVFDYADNMSLEALIQMAGGFKEGATPGRVEISRRIKNSDATSVSAQTAEVFTVNVDGNLKIQDTGFVLKPFDIVSIRSSEGYQVQKQVRIEGEVLYPATYTITKKDERISDLIKRAGGLSPLAYVEGASLKRTGGNYPSGNKADLQEEERIKLLNLQRLKQDGAKDTGSIDNELKILRSDLVGINLERILKKPQSRHDLILEDGDVIRVPKQLQTVRVTGEVLKPNSIIYIPGRSFRSYIDGSGGFSYSAYKKGAYVVYSNGSVAAAKKFLFFNNYPVIKPGAEIFVPKRAEREKMNLQTIVGLTTGLASLAAIVISLIK